MGSAQSSYRLQVADEDDKILVRKAKQDVEAFGRLYDRYYDEISRYIYRRTLDRSLTEDLASNTFYAAVRSIHKFRWRRIPFGAWLYRIATNEIRMHFRKAANRPTVSLQSDRSADIAVVSGLEDPGPSPGDAAAASERFAHIQHAIATLRDDYQAAITLRFFQGKSVKEVARILGRREGTVKSFLHRGLEQLRPLLADHDLSETE